MSFNIYCKIVFKIAYTNGKQSLKIHIYFSFINIKCSLIFPKLKGKMYVSLMAKLAKLAFLYFLISIMIFQVSYLLVMMTLLIFFTINILKF